jgi:hypothetical protein
MSLRKPLKQWKGKNGSKWVLADIGSDTKFETKGVLYYTLNDYNETKLSV